MGDTVVVSARRFVHHSGVYSGDWSPSGAENCECSGFHTCTPIDEQYLDWFTRIEVSKKFEQSVLDKGIIHGLSIEPDYWDRTTAVLCNGHHRLMIAYKHNLFIPLDLCMTDRRSANRWGADNDGSLPNSGDPSRYRADGDLASFDVNKYITKE